MRRSADITKTRAWQSPLATEPNGFITVKKEPFYPDRFQGGRSNLFSLIKIISPPIYEILFARVYPSLFQIHQKNTFLGLDQIFFLYL